MQGTHASAWQRQAAPFLPSIPAATYYKEKIGWEPQSVTNAIQVYSDASLIILNEAHSQKVQHV